MTARIRTCPECGKVLADQGAEYCSTRCKDAKYHRISRERRPSISVSRMFYRRLQQVAKQRGVTIVEIVDSALEGAP